MAKKSSSGRAVLFAGGLIVLFVFLTLFEVWFAAWMGFDIIAHLQVSKSEGELKFFFEAFGVIAFVLFQPIVFTVLFLKLSKSIAETLVRNLSAWFMND
jgi:ABC-type uncharacterized transport system fused permease/ATPase subunit